MGNSALSKLPKSSPTFHLLVITNVSGENQVVCIGIRPIDTIVVRYHESLVVEGILRSRIFVESESRYTRIDALIPESYAKGMQVITDSITSERYDSEYRSAREILAEEKDRCNTQ